MLVFTQMNYKDQQLAFKFKPRLIVHGPWGTGKTETILQTICFLLKKHLEVQLQAERENVSLDCLPPQRILLATLTNSAADLCITKTFDKFGANNPRVKLLRIMAPHRRINTIPPEILKYCKLSEPVHTGQQQSPLLPTIDEILNATILVVTENCAISALLESCMGSLRTSSLTKRLRRLSHRHSDLLYLPTRKLCSTSCRVYCEY